LTIADIAIAAGLAVVFSNLLGEEERKAYPNLTAWYLSIVATDAVIGSKDLPKEAHKAFKGKHQKHEKKPEQKEEKKE
jgi:glutathione S-transferase